MDKLLRAAVAALLCITLACGLWARWSHQKAQDATKRAEVAEASVKELKRTTARLDASVRAERAAATKAAAQRKEVERALQENSDWADRPVPDSVWDSLGFPASSAPRVD